MRVSFLCLPPFFGASFLHFYLFKITSESLVDPVCHNVIWLRVRRLVLLVPFPNSVFTGLAPPELSEGWSIWLRSGLGAKIDGWSM